MPYPLPLTRTEAYLAYKAGVIQQSDLKPSLAVPRNGIDAWLAYWTGLAEDYPKREDGTPLILQEEEAYIAYLCGVINEYPEKCLRRVGAYLRYLISARWGMPDHPLNREELYLSLIKTQFIPSGDPSSDIVIDGTAKAPFVDVKMYGDTFQQSYTGKNLFPSSVTWDQNRAYPTSYQGGWDNWAGYYGFLDYIEVEPDTTYTFSNAEGLGFVYGLQYYDSDKNWISGADVAVTFTTPSNCHYIRGAVLSSTAPTQCQLELGSTATSYEPYVGGQPSPNPDYPQTIQTVTGEQTISINGTNYPISLGSLELCKLGTYQDYIWKDGDSWKLHKATKKVELDEQSGWTKNQYGTNSYKVIAQDISTLQTTVCVASQFFTGVSYDGRRVTTQNIVFADSQPGIQASDRGISIRNTPWSDTTSLLAWVASNHIIVYYLLLTPTDTVITDQNLINQLNALKQGGAEEGTTYIKVSATDPNLPAKLYVEAPKYD